MTRPADPRRGGHADRPRIVVSGVGFVGRALVRALDERGVQVVRLVRRPVAEERDLVSWNPARGVDDTSALEGATAAIHFGGEGLASGRWTAARKRRLRESRIGSTRMLAETLARLDAPPATFLTASAVGWYGSRGDERLDESSSAGTGFLAELCREWEEAAAPAREAGIRWAALRFGVVLGRGGALAKMLPAFRLGLGAVLGDGRQFMSWIELGDAVAAVLHVLDSELEGPLNVVAPAAVTNREFTRALSRALGRPAFLMAPKFALKPLGEMARETLLASQRVAPKRLSESGFEFRFREPETALRHVLG
jgi:uncharacterized protein (TIGR01777 family)